MIAHVTKSVLALGLCCALAACASTPRMTAEPSVEQKLTVECVASNAAPSGCRTTHEIAVVARWTRADQGTPSIADLRDETARQPRY